LELFFGFYIKSRVLDGDCTPLPRPPVLQKRGPDYTNTDVEASDCGEHRRAAAAVAISEPLLELIVVSAVGALYFGCGYFCRAHRDVRQIPQRNGQARPLVMTRKPANGSGKAR